MQNSEADVPGPVVAGKYRLTRLLGSGGMGSVWEGTHVTLGTRVAVKLIDASYAQSVEARLRFENEARAAAKLRSKHVVEVYDHGLMEDGRPFMVMEFMQGEPLDARFERLGRVPPAELAPILLQVCRGLAKAHAAGIVHRDLKPENIFLVWDEEDGAFVTKVLDFGIAKFTDRSLGASSGTRTGSVLGTPYYMSPEQARGLRSVDHRSDVWSLGVIAFRGIVGQLPFTGEAVGDLLVKLCTAPVPVPSQITPDVPRGFDALIARSLQREPADRFQSVQEFAAALASVCGVAQGAAPTPWSESRGGVSAAQAPAVTPAPHGHTGSPAATGASFTQTPAPASGSGRAAWIALAVGGAAVLAIAGVLMLRAFNARAALQPAASVTLATQAPANVPSEPPKPAAEPVAEAAVAPAPSALAPAPSASALAPAEPEASPPARPLGAGVRLPATAARVPPARPRGPAPSKSSGSTTKREIDIGY